MQRSAPRRRFLRGCGATVALGVTGCLGAGGRTTPTEQDGGVDGTTPTVTPSSDFEPPARWAFPLDSPTTRPTVDGEWAYVGTEDGELSALATGDGHREWRVDLGDPVAGRPLVGDDRVFVVSGETALYSHQRVSARATDTGEEVWQFEPESWWLDLLGIEDGLLYVATSDDALSGGGQTLYAVDVASGEAAWSREVGDGGRGLIADGTVYVPSAGRLYAYDAADGTHHWSRRLTDYGFRTIAATAEVVSYVDEVDDRRLTLVGVDAATGDRRWTLQDWRATSTTLHDGVLYVGGERLAAVDPATGERPWEREAGGFVPRVPVRDGRLYVGGDGVRAHALGDGAREWAWTPEPAVEGAIPAAAAAGTVYVDTFREADPRNRYKFAVDAASGEPRWVFDGETGLTEMSRPVPGGVGVLVGGEDGRVVALASE